MTSRRHPPKARRSPHLVEKLLHYELGDLAPQELSRIRKHLASCPECRMRHRRFRAGWRWLKQQLRSR